MTISYSKRNTGGNPCRSCSRKLLPRWRSVSQNRMERCAKSTPYRALPAQSSANDVGFVVNSATCSRACCARSLKRPSASLVRVSSICATFADTSWLSESCLVNLLIVSFFLDRYPSNCTGGMDCHSLNHCALLADVQVSRRPASASGFASPRTLSHVGMPTRIRALCVETHGSGWQRSCGLQGSHARSLGPRACRVVSETSAFDGNSVWIPFHHGAHRTRGVWPERCAAGH